MLDIVAGLFITSFFTNEESARCVTVVADSFIKVLSLDNALAKKLSAVVVLLFNGDEPMMSLLWRCRSADGIFSIEVRLSASLGVRLFLLLSLAGAASPLLTVLSVVVGADKGVTKGFAGVRC